MLILKPVSVETIWGSTRLYDYCGDRNMPKIGQLYTVAAQENISNEITNGQFRGQTLSHVFKNNRDLFNYNSYEVFPLLIGFVDAKDNLSIQVHPTDEYAREVEGMPFGKSESWFFIEAPESGTIYDGLKCRTIEELKENIKNGTVMHVVDTLRVNKGDYVYVENGTIHALRAGSLVYEIQQSTDITYRFYDYDRVNDKGEKRPLHLDKALSVINPLKKSESLPGIEGKKYQEEYYSTEMRAISGEFENSEKVFVSVTVIDGSLEHEGIEIKKGMSFIAFPNEKVSFEGSAKCIIAVPK